MTRTTNPHAAVVISLSACVAALCLTPTAVAGDDIVTVKVKGQGIDRDAAIKDAQRNAVEQGGKNEIASRTKTKDFALEYDVVLARASGLLKGFTVLSETENAGVVTVQIEAQVSKKLIDATWADVTILLKQLGRPKIMVMFTERIHDLDRPEHNREITQQSSQLTARIQRKLLKLGFKVVSAGQMKEIDRKKAEVASLEDDTAALKALASGYGAAICIKGVSRASGPQRTTAAGVKLHMWEADMTVDGFWTETGDMIFANSLVGTRGGSRVAGPPGAAKALEKTGNIIADASVFDMLEAWSRGTAGGVGDIIVEVHGVADIKQAILIKKALAAVSGVEEVQKDGVKGTVKYTVVTNMNAETFIEHMIEFSFDGFELDFEDQKMKTIVCRVK